MKTLILTLILVLPNLGWTKIDDLGEMIVQNAGDQKKLHQELKTVQGWETKIDEKPVSHKDILETTVTEYTPKTKKSLLTYDKEKGKAKSRRAAFHKNKMKQVTAELNDSHEF